MNNSGRVALVTGASSGIGRACAVRLAAEGFRVYGASRRLTADGDLSSTFQAIPMDVTDTKSVADGVASILAREGRLDILVNNAGMGVAGPVESTSVEEAKRQLDVNFFGAFRLCRSVLPAMRAQGSGYIVNVGSIGGMIAIPYQALYSASKFALEGLSEALRLEVGPLGIRVVLIQPGDYKTQFTQNRQPTANSGEVGIYQRSFQSALARMIADEQSGPPPEEVARLLQRIVETSNPRLRYTVGKLEQRSAVWVKRLLPYSILERAMRRYYRL